MSWRRVLAAVVRLAIIASVASSGVMLGSDEAEARRGGKVRSAKERVHHGGAAAKSKPDEEAPETDGAPARRSRPPHQTPVAADTYRDIEVPGCAEGMICTVCVAGCTGDIGGIVDTQLWTPMPAARR